jgi:hypothetical protein
VEIYNEGVGSILRFVSYEVGDESRVGIWHDLWCEEQPLKISYTKLFSIARCKDPWVADHMQIESLMEYLFTIHVHD